jgi:hypothetical protein
MTIEPGTEYDHKYDVGVWRLIPDETRVAFKKGSEPFKAGHRFGMVRKIGSKYVHIETDIRMAGAIKARMVKMPISNWNGFDQKVPGIRRLR